MLNIAAGILVTSRDVLRNVERECGLAHARPSRHDHEVARLQARRHLVEVSEPGRDAGDVAWIVALVERVDALDHLGEQRLDFAETLAAACAGLGNREHVLLGLIEQVFRRAAERIEHRIGDAGADFRQPAHDRALAHDFGVTPDVGGTRSVHRQRAEVRLAADFFELGAALEAFGNRQRIRRLVVLDEHRDMAVDQAMVGAIEIVGGQEIGDLFPRAVVEQQAAQHGLLRLDRIWRQLQRIDLRIAVERGYGLCHGGDFRLLLGSFCQAGTTAAARKAQGNLLKKKGCCQPFFHRKNFCFD